MKIFISFFFFFVGNTPLGLPFKETFNDILISSVAIHPAKVCIFFITNEYFIVNKYIPVGNKYSCSKEIYFYTANKCFIVNKYILLAINI